MSSAPKAQPESPPVADPGDWARPIYERQLAILSRLAAVGMDLVEALGAQAEGGPTVVQGDLALAQDRAARSVRQTLMLQDRVVGTLKDHEAGRAAHHADLAAHAARLVRGAIEDDADVVRGDTERAEHLRTEAAERLRGEDVGDLFSRPFGEAVAGLCKGLDLSPDWLALAEACLAVEQELARGPDATGKPADDDGPLEVYWLDSGVPRPASSWRRAADSS